MINSEEHKRILEQITELERNSTNFFNVEKEFFLIDSENLLNVQTRFYGYSIQATGIYEEDNLTEEAVAGLDGRGCYVYVEARNGKITIKQDLNGCWGIYLFRHGDYFALSNSFFRLLDHVKFKYTLTVNRDYCNYLLINLVCSHTYSETAVNEIQLIERNAILRIDKTKRTLETELTDYRENTIPLDSAEGIKVLDNWVEFWGNVFRSLVQQTKFITADLSGGFDSRIAFLLLVNSGINLKEINIKSIKRKDHTFSEDYAIASKIAEHYGLKLNQPLPDNQVLNFSFSDAYNIDLYSHQIFHKSPSIGSTKNVNKIYSITGLGGEIIRNYWYCSPEEFIKGQIRKVNPYSRSVSREITVSVESIIKSVFRIVRDKYKIEDENSTSIPQYFYQETRCRHHFGKIMARNYLGNVFQLSPIIDPLIRCLKLNTKECLDNNLLIGLIFMRYEPELLTFPFDSGHSIAFETIAYAKKINESFPRKLKDVVTGNSGEYFHLQPRDKEAEYLLALRCNNKEISNDFLKYSLKILFESSRTYGLFTSHFSEEFYTHAMSYYDNNSSFSRLRMLYSVVGIAKVLEYVEIGQRNRSPYDGMKHFFEQDYTIINTNTELTFLKFKKYFTARIDIKLMSTVGDFQIFSFSDEKVRIAKPAWFQGNGVGYVIQSYFGKLEFVAKTTMGGKIGLSLRGIDMREPEDRSKRIPYWIDYTKLSVNEKLIFDKLTPAWHDKPYAYDIKVKAGEEIKIQVEWLPHRSDT